MQTLWQDLRYGTRMLWKQPGFTLIAVLTLALGIGANAAIYSVVNAVLLDPFPYRDHYQLVQLRQNRPKVGVGQQILHAGPEFLTYRDQAVSFQQMAAVETVSRNITVGGEVPERVFGAKVSADFFTMLGVAPQIGRTLLPEEQGPGAPASIVIGQGLWQRRFGGDASVIGRTIELDGESYAVVGVMPPRFRYGGTEFWFPFPFDLSQPARAQRWYGVLARMKPDVSLRQANAELEAIARSVERDHVSGHAEYAGWKVSAMLLRDALLGSVRSAVLVLTGAVVLVLLIVCANISSLLLARAAVRQHEVAIRAAIGAGRGRLLRQFLTESALLALIGGGLGLLLGAWAVDGLAALIPTGSFLPGGNIPAEAVISLSTPAIIFTAVVSLATILLFGLWPALHSSRVDLNAALRDADRAGAGGAARQRALNLLVVSEMALALVLLVGAGLLLRSFIEMMRVDPGFNPENVLSMRFNLPPGKYRSSAEKAAFYQRLVEQMRVLPGVESAAVASQPPFWFSEQWNFALEGQTAPEQRLSADSRTVSPDYHTLLGIPLVKGRLFTERDLEGQPSVAIINQTMARRYWGDRDPVGQRFLLYVGNAGPFPQTVVGVVGDSLQVSFDQPVQPEMNFPMPQAAGLYRRMNLIVRTTVEPSGLVESIRRQVWQLDKQLPMYGTSTMRESINTSISTRRFALWLLALFAGVALVLALAGIYGVMAYSVTQRRHEIGVRMALGAQARDVLKLVIGQGLKLALAGVLIGLGGALALVRLLKTLLFGVSATDPLTFGAVALLLTGVALVACWIPARRAMKLDPMAALRCE